MTDTHATTQRPLTPDEETLVELLADFLDQLTAIGMVGAVALQVLTTRNRVPHIHTLIRARDQFADKPAAVYDAFVDGIKDVRNNGKLEMMGKVFLNG